MFSVQVSLSAILVPQSWSNVTSARILGDVVLSKERSGSFCANFSQTPSKQSSYPSLHHFTLSTPLIL